MTYVCARGPGGLDKADLDALQASVERFLETRCQAESLVPVPVRARRGEGGTYHCGLPAGHTPEEGHRWPVEPDRLIVAWCDWPRPTCRHGNPEDSCPACSACDACDGSCGTCPYARMP